MMRDLGLIAKLPRIVVRPGRAAPTRSTAPTCTNFETFEPIQAAEDPGQRHPDRQPGQRREGRPHPEAVRRHRRAGQRGRSWPTPRRSATAPACSTARTPAWPWPR
ncbi:MAG: hypothetical protein MZU97_08925 [Bacillus subtilis]|nr:hypothetical protein [Bacillus subtilis]